MNAIGFGGPAQIGFCLLAFAAIGVLIICRPELIAFCAYCAGCLRRYFD